MAHSAGIPAVIFKLRYPKIPYILTLQEGDPLDHIKRLALPVWPLFRRVFRTPTVVQAISQYLAQWARDMGYKGDVQVIPNAVDASRFSRREYADAEDEKKLKAELGKETGDIYLAHTGRLIEKNGLEDLIGALEFLPGNVKLLLVGTGPQEDKLRRLAYNKNISDRVKFLGYVPIEEVAAYLKISDIFARPSLSEGMGNSFIEAMAVGLPVIATPVGGIVDFLFDPKANPDKAPTGLFCNVNDPQSIATQVTWLLDNPDLKEQIVSNAQSLVLRQYEWNNVVEDMKRKVFDVALKES
jgi:glycosyltransferase involved in cell wall biosynthesis